MTKFPDAPLNKKHPKVFYRVGAISLQWNRIDYHLELLLKSLIKDESILSVLSNAQRAQLLQAYLTKGEGSKWLAYVKHVMDGINICRENRNFIMHGLVHEMGEDFMVVERVTRDLKRKRRVHISLDDLEEVERGMMQFGAHLRHFLDHLAPLRIWGGREHISLPEKSPLPDRLEKILPEVPVDDLPPPRSSGA